MRAAAATQSLVVYVSFASVVFVDSFAPFDPSRKAAAARAASWFAGEGIRVVGRTTEIPVNLLTLEMAEDENAGAPTEIQQDRLQSLLDYIQNREKGRESCGLDANEKEQDLVASVIAEVEQDEQNNLVKQRKDGEITFADLQGNWQLLYTSSRTMIINKSLTGLGRSSSEYSQFTRLVMKLGGNKYIGAVEFVETFGESALEVNVSGEWFTKPRTNLFTREPTTSIAIDPENVTFGLGNNKADDWSSLGPIKLLDLLYLSQDLMISRGGVNPKSLFVWKRAK